MRIQPNANAFGNTAAAARSLIGAGLRDALDRQALNFTAMAVAADACMAGVDDAANARNGQRCFGDIGGQYNAQLAAFRIKNPFLFADTQF